MEPAWESNPRSGWHCIGKRLTANTEETASFSHERMSTDHHTKSPGDLRVFKAMVDRFGKSITIRIEEPKNN